MLDKKIKAPIQIETTKLIDQPQTTSEAIH